MPVDVFCLAALGEGTLSLFSHRSNLSRKNTKFVVVLQANVLQ